MTLTPHTSGKASAWIIARANELGSAASKETGIPITSAMWPALLIEATMEYLDAHLPPKQQ